MQVDLSEKELKALKKWYSEYEQSSYLVKVDIQLIDKIKEAYKNYK